MGKGTQAVVVLLMGLLATACSSASDRSTPSQASDNAGWRIVHSSSPRWTEGGAWTVPSQPKLVIGVPEGPEEYQFVRIEDAARLSDGKVVVVDRGAQTVRLYDPGGRFLRALGGGGGGPGEFTDPVSVLVVAGDTMVVWDQALLRTTRFNPSGDLASTQTVDWGGLASRLGVEMVSKGRGSAGKSPGVPTGSIFPGPMEPLGDGGFLVRLVEKREALPASGSYRSRSGALRISADLSVIDTLMLFGDTEQVVVDAPWGPFAVTPPGARRTRIAHYGNPPRICIGDQEDRQISCIGAGREKILLRWDMDPTPLTAADVSGWREESVRLLDPKLDRDQVLEMLGNVPIPRFRPPFSQLFLDPTGDLWAELGPTRGTSAASNGFLVFAPEGILLGVVDLPPIQILEVGRDHVLGVYEDELAIQYVHMYQLRKLPVQSP